MGSSALLDRLAIHDPLDQAIWDPPEHYCYSLCFVLYDPSSPPDSLFPDIILLWAIIHTTLFAKLRFVYNIYGDPPTSSKYPLFLFLKSEASLLPKKDGLPLSS